jgi:hypothetical protein
MGIKNLFIYMNKNYSFDKRIIGYGNKIKNLNLKYPLRLISLKHVRFNYDRLLGPNIVSLIRKNLILLRKEIR